jgi:hypothetical protein
MVHSVHYTYSSTRIVQLRLIKINYPDRCVTVFANGMPNSITYCEQENILDYKAYDLRLCVITMLFTP